MSKPKTVRNSSQKQSNEFIDGNEISLFASNSNKIQNLNVDWIIARLHTTGTQEFLPPPAPSKFAYNLATNINIAKINDTKRVSPP